MQNQASIWLIMALTATLFFQGSAVWSGGMLRSAAEEQKTDEKIEITTGEYIPEEKEDDAKAEEVPESVYLKDYKISKGTFSQNRSVNSELDVLTEVKVGEERTAVPEEIKPERKLSVGLKKAIRDLRPGTEVEILISFHWDYWDDTDMVIRSIKDVVGEDMIYEKIKFSRIQMKVDISFVLEIAELKTVLSLGLPEENVKIIMPEIDSEKNTEKVIRNNETRINSSSEMMGVKKLELILE